MMNLQECRTRAELCLQFAELEPNSKSLWLPEAERWSRLTHEQMSPPMRQGELVKTHALDQDQQA
jgi:hypothetical protein